MRLSFAEFLLQKRVAAIESSRALSGSTASRHQTPFLEQEDCTSGQAEWTILVFLNAKNDLEPFAFPTFEQMSSIGSTPEVNLVVEMGRPKAHQSKRYGGWSKTLRFLVSKGTLPNEGEAVSTWRSDGRKSCRR
jgi:hypothetical protein